MPSLRAREWLTLVSEGMCACIIIIIINKRRALSCLSKPQYWKKTQRDFRSRLGTVFHEAEKRPCLVWR